VGYCEQSLGYESLDANRVQHDQQVGTKKTAVSPFEFVTACVTRCNRDVGEGGHLLVVNGHLSQPGGSGVAPEYLEVFLALAFHEDDKKVTNNDEAVGTGIARIDFHGDTVLAFKDEKTGRVFASVRQACDAIGLDVSAQLRKIQIDPVYSCGLRGCRVATPGGKQESLFLEKKFFHRWLYSINAKLVRSNDLFFDINRPTRAKRGASFIGATLSA